MNQPSLPNTTTTPPPPPPPPGPPLQEAPGRRRIPKPPTPEELIAHYESQGLDYKEASVKAIRELQGILYRTAAAARGGGPSPRGRMDDVSARLAVLEAKLDSKPGFAGALGVGVAAGVATPFVLGGLGRVWGLVRDATAAGNGR